ncbi:MAG TPA: hypothetical protein VFU15_13670 [Bacteroidia bacterium]|nr:hypothetical protein [Bacteroidia bacterium]
MTAQAPSWAFATQYGSAYSQSAYRIAVDKNDNYYVAGQFAYDLWIGPVHLQGHAPSGSWNIFLAKFGPGGNVLWAREFGGFCTDLITGMSIDTLGGIFLCGSFCDTINIDNVHLLAADISGSNNSYVIKFDGNGNALWGKDIVGKSPCRVECVAADGAGGVFAGGYFSDTLITGAQVLHTTGVDDAFISRIGASGNTLWAQRDGGAYYEAIQYLCTDNAHHVYAGGKYTNSSVFGSYALNNAPGQDDFFVASYDFSGGNANWATDGSIGGPDNINYLGGIAYDNIGGIVLSGGFTGTLSFTGSATGISPNYDDNFLVRMDTLGIPSWQTHGGNGGADDGKSIACDHFGNIYQVADFFGNVVFDTLQVTNPNMSSFATTAIVRYSPGGHAQWALLPACTSLYGFYDVAVRDGNPVVCGEFYNDITLGGTPMNAVGAPDIVITEAAFPMGIGETPRPAFSTDCFPDPATDLIRLRAPSAGHFRVSIYDDEGNLAFCCECDAAEKNDILSIDSSLLPPGAYVGQLTGNVCTAPFRFMIAR